MDATACVKTRKGHHYWFMIDPDQAFPSWAHHDDTIGFDVKCESGGVMCPPSPHPDGGFYEWVRPPESTLSAPTWLLGGSKSLSALLSGRIDEDGFEAAELDNPAVRSLLLQLLENPPIGDGGRNDWLIKVAGHFAKVIPYADTYRHLVLEANEKLSPPLAYDEAKKTSDSAWNMEKAKGLGTIQVLREQGVVTIDSNPSDINGWLVGVGNAILCPAIISDGDNKKAEVMMPWADFDIKVIGIVNSGETVDYLVHVTTAHGTQECVLKGSTLGRSTDLMVWLAERRATIIPPDGDRHKRAGMAQRLTRYVKSQDAKSYRFTNVLGWDELSGAFISHDGIIHAESTSVEPFEDVRPTLDLKKKAVAPYHYGFVGSRSIAQHVLREMMTFHDGTVCAVFGAWWAVSFVKEQILKHASLFPFMAMEAPSESGKSTGFFAGMVGLSGNTEGHGEYTPAALRDRVGAHNAGLVWIDDVSELSATLEIIRQATSGGSRSKKGEDRATNERVKLLAPIALSGEGIQGLAVEKALGDRAVKLIVPKVVDRRSLHDETKSQWDDVTALAIEWGNDFTQLAGWYVAMALECSDIIEEWSNLKPSEVSGRFADSMTTLRIGARILEYLTGVSDDWVVRIVDAWVAEQASLYNPDANMLTNTILPWALREANWPRSPSPSSGRIIYIDSDNIVWFHEGNVSDSWLSQHRRMSSRETELGTIENIRQQRERLSGEARSVQKWTEGKGSSKLRYWKLSVEESARVIELSGYET
jgi:hypothetical protein